MQLIVSTCPDNKHQVVPGYLSETRDLSSQKVRIQQIIYVKNYFAPSITREFEIEFLELSRWENLQ